mgnify:CR=1 FL=1
MIIGNHKLKPGATVDNRGHGDLSALAVGGALRRDVRVGAVLMYMRGSGALNQVIRPVVGAVKDMERVLYAGAEKVIPANMPPQWVTLPFSRPPRLLAGSTPYAGWWGGPTGGGPTTPGARVYYVGSGATGFVGTAQYSPTANPVMSSEFSYGLRFMIAALAWEFPDPAEQEIPDLIMARRPWNVAQEAFGRAGVVAGSRRFATAGWHGPFTDPEAGSFAIVRSDGPLADLVGERVRVTYRAGTLARSVAVYVHDEHDFGEDAADEDISLARRAMLALAPLRLDSIPVEVEVLG